MRTKGDKIGVWLGDSNASESIITVGKKFKERLNIDPQVIKNWNLWIFRENSKNKQILQKLKTANILQQTRNFPGKVKKINKVTKNSQICYVFGHLHRAQGQKIYSLKKARLQNPSDKGITKIFSFPDCLRIWSTSGYNETFWVYSKKSLRCLKMWMTPRVLPMNFRPIWLFSSAKRLVLQHYYAHYVKVF